jgi:glycosyltransferase involved in cell wall biosynthesis
MGFTLVSTVFNEMERIDNTIQNLENQTVKPKRIIITDAGSSDGTYERLIKWKEDSQLEIEVLQEVRCNVARGRNLAIEAAETEYIVSTDFGCIHEPFWLASLVQHLEEDPSLVVVGGAYSVLDETILTVPAKAEYILQNGYDIPINEHYTVTSRSIAYKKRVWKELNGYPEWLTLASDDSTFWKRIKKAQYKYKINPKVGVYWLRHNSLKGFIAENQRYGKGDGESKTNFRNLISHLIESLLRYYLFIGLLFAGLYPSSWLIFLPGLLGLRSYFHASKHWWRLKSTKYHLGILVYSFYMIERLRIAYILAYLKAYRNQTPLQRENALLLHQELGKYAG